MVPVLQLVRKIGWDLRGGDLKEVSDDPVWEAREQRNQSP